MPHSAAMLHSVLVHVESPLEIHYLHGSDVSSATRRRLQSMVEAEGASISFLRVRDQQVAGLRTLKTLPSAAWYRTFLPQLLPDVDRIVYLDIDTIVVDSLEPLWETELDDHYLAAVTNVLQENDFDRPAQLGLPSRDAYFNSGVTLMNLELMRRDGITRRLLDYALAHPYLMAWAEQDALNGVLSERRLPLHPRWNLMNSILVFPWSVEVFGVEAVAEARSNPAVRHFEGPGPNKPWHLLCDHPMREHYVEHRRLTPWPRYRPEGMTPANVLRLVRDARRRRRHRGRARHGITA